MSLVGISSRWALTFLTPSLHSQAFHSPSIDIEKQREIRKKQSHKWICVKKGKLPMIHSICIKSSRNYLKFVENFKLFTLRKTRIMADCCQGILRSQFHPAIKLQIYLKFINAIWHVFQKISRHYIHSVSSILCAGWTSKMDGRKP